MNFGSKRNKPANKKKKPPKQMPNHVGLVDKLKKRNEALEMQIKKLRGK